MNIITIRLVLVGTKPHRLLKLKLEYYVVRNQALKWISSFLEERTQRVVCGGYTSDSAIVISGVPCTGHCFGATIVSNLYKQST